MGGAIGGFQEFQKLTESSINSSISNSTEIDLVKGKIFSSHHTSRFFLCLDSSQDENWKHYSLFFLSFFLSF